MSMVLGGNAIERVHLGDTDIHAAFFGKDRVLSDQPCWDWGAPYRHFNEETGVLSMPYVCIAPCTKEEIGDFEFKYGFYGCAINGVIDFSDTKQIGNSSLHTAFRSVANILMNDIEIRNLENIRTIGSYGMYCCFTGSDAHLTGEISFSALQSVASSGLRETFSRCTGVLIPSEFQALETLGADALRQCFSGCETFVETIKFPSLKALGNTCLTQAFYGCNNIKEVHFPEALAGNEECTAANMGCENATVYFDL